ncbi:MAG: hypothetical protein ACREX3_22560, partial [Gammaproteobacteria bacterium]
LWVLHHELLQFGVLIIVQVQGTEPFERGRLDECEHIGATIRLWRMDSNIASQVVVGCAVRTIQDESSFCSSHPG